MKSRLFGIALAACMLALPVMGHANPTYDFSDVAKPFLTLPFEVVNVEVVGEGATIKHVYHLADSYDSVTKKLIDMFNRHSLIGNYVIMGVTEQTVSEMYQTILAINNEHYYAQITPEGAGCAFALEAMPKSYVSGVYDAVIYGFRMPNGETVSAELANQE